MKLVSIRLRNYKSFSDSNELHFRNGFNVIVGQNNAGKSALLQGISLRFTDNAHLSLKTKPSKESPISPRSDVLFSVECGGQELRTILLNGDSQYHIPVPDTRQFSEEELKQVLDDLFSSQQIIFSLRCTGGNTFEATKIPSFDKYTSSNRFWIIQSRADKLDFQIVSANNGATSRAHEVGTYVGKIFLHQLYFFHAERMLFAEVSFGSNPVLDSNARNLPEVLNVLQSNAERFNRFNRYVNQIFPTIRRVAVRPNPHSGALQIVVWTVAPETEREDLAISLADSGTGVGQVLAILYVAVTSPPPLSRMIVIDEPNSFLNPGAAKKLIEILHGFDHLQFIISTHSPDIVRAAQPQTLSVIHWSDGVSTVEQMEAGKMNTLQLVLREVGASLSDVFGADRVLWVEGPTEEVCFRILIERYLRRQLMGTAIAAVHDIGRLTSRRPSAKLVWDIYTKLSGVGALMPPALAFSFDREGRTEQEINDIKRQSNNKVHFLPRRMYENYLIDADAIAAVLSTEMKGEFIITAETVQIWISKHSNDFLPANSRDAVINSSTWLKDINGAGLLDRLFVEISDNKVFFDKVWHGSMLTEQLIDKKPETLTELREYLEGLLSLTP